MRTHLRHTTLSALALLPTLLLAQGQGSTPGGEYYIHGIFNPVIADVRKIDIRPTAFDSIVPDRSLKYDLLPVRGDVPARVDSITPAKLNVVQPQQRLYKGYAKAGFGLYTTPLGELYYNQTRSRKNTFGVHLKHMSSNGGIANSGPSDLSFNNVDGFYKHFLPRHEVGGRITYDRRRVNYYGYDPANFEQSLLDQVAREEDLKRVYNDIGFAARVKSLYRDSTKLAHAAGMEVHAFSNDADSRETNVVLDARVSKEDGSETYSAGLVLDNLSYSGAATNGLAAFKQSGTLVGLTPEVSTRGDKYLVRVGAGMYVDALQKTTFHFFPKVDMSYSLFDDILVPYAGVDGARVRNSFRNLSRENAWVTAAPTLANSSRLYDIFGGMRGSLSSRMGFDVRASYSRTKDMPLFITDVNTPLNNQFAVVYDRVDVLDLGGKLTYDAGDGIRATGGINIYTYTTDGQADAWNLPPYALALGGQWDIRHKLILKAEAQFIGRRPAFSGVDSTGAVVARDLDGFLDLYLGAEYRYNKRLSVFIDVSNLSASKYERWYGQRVQRGLVLGGATFAF
ncbi:MAG: hypothetical protein JNM31_09515 [Flavobacteriales bacterium]|nr:hypothetical protein [Flavobacteriales bacterium]